MTESTYWQGRAQYIFESHFQRDGGRHLLTQLLDRLVRLAELQQDSVILEVGCAAGTQTVGFLRKGYARIFGIDLDPSVLGMAHGNARRYAPASGCSRFLCGDALNLPFADDSVDLVFSIGVMEHIPQMRKALQEQHRVVKPGGALLVAVPNLYCPWWHTLKRLKAALSKRPEHAFPDIFRTFTPKQIRSALADVGCVDTRVEVADAVVPQLDGPLAGIAVRLEQLIERIPLIRNMQAMVYAVGRK